MPLISSPNRGYADWQRVENYDSGTLFTTFGYNAGDDQTSPILDMSRYACVGGYDINQSGPCNVLMTWYADAAGTVPLGSRSFQLSQLIIRPAQYRIPNIGPFLQIEWTQLGAGNLIHTCNIIGTNRQDPTIFIPYDSLMIDQQNAFLGANASQDTYPSSYSSGPHGVCVLANQNMLVTFITLSAGNTWDTFYQQLVTAGEKLVDTVVTPNGAWKANVMNEAANVTTYYLTAVASSTGSS